MFLGKIIGTVVATVKDESLTGLRLLVVQPLDENEAPAGTPLVAADALRTCGEGDLVYLVRRKEAAVPFSGELTSLDAAVVGFIDEFYIAGRKEQKEDQTTTATTNATAPST